MKKLKSMLDIQSFNEQEISIETKSNVIGGQVQETLNFTSTMTETCEWSCQDLEIENYQDGKHTGSYRADTFNDC